MKCLWTLALLALFFSSVSLAGNPNREFLVDKTLGYGPLNVTFDASSIKPAKKYYWAFGNGETLITSNSIVTYSYKSVGNFTASLKFAVNASDKDLKNLKDAGSVLINVQERPNPTPNLAPVANISCSANNLLINCNGLSSYDPEGQPLSFKFDFGEGIIESNTSGLASHAYAVAGLYTVKLSVIDSAGASSLAVAQVQAVKPANKLPELNLACTSEAINTLVCNATGSTDLDGAIVSYQYAWDDNAIESKADSNSIAHIFTSSGNHTVTLTATDNDGGVSVLVKSFTVKANANPSAAFSCDTSKPEKVICSSTSTDSDVGDSIQSYSWKFGEHSAFSTTAANTDYDFKAGGIFNVTLVVTDSYGGTGSFTQSIAVKSNLAPVATFTCSNTGIGLIHCASNASDEDGAIAFTNWALDDGTNFEGLSFDHKFNSGVEHTISLTVTDDLGISSTSSKIVQLTANQLPTFDFISDVITGAAPLAVHFQIQNAADVDGSIGSYSIDFGDNTFSPLLDVTHSYTNAGTYTVTAKVADDLGGVTTKSKQIVVQAPVITNPPQAYFKYYQDGTYLELHANITKTQYDIKRAFYTIDDSQTIELTEFFPNTINAVEVGNYGVHTIKLTVIDTTGQIGVFTHAFELKEDLSQIQPFVTFNARQSSPRTVFVNMNGAFTSDLDEEIEYFHVEYGNGFSEDIYDTFATYTYPQTGSYLIKVTAVTTKQTQSNATRNITITNNVVPVVQPIAAFAYNIYQFAQNVTFYNERSGSPNGGIISYLWDFGDGTTGTGELAAHFYNPGSYFVKLTVTDFAGYSSSQTQHITVVGTGGDIAANISCWNDGDLKVACNFVALDKLKQINSVKVMWGDSIISSLSTALIPEYGFYEASHSYTAAGNKTITLMIKTSRGVNKTISIVKEVASSLQFYATLSCTVQNALATCNSLGSLDSTGSALTYTFNYGDGFSETNANGLSSHAFSSGGLFAVSVIVTNASGAQAMAATQVQIVIPVNKLPLPSLYCYSIEPYILKCNPNGSIDFDGSIVSYKYEWDDNTNEVVGNSEELFHIFAEGGSHQVTLTVTDDDGGVKSITNSFDVRLNNPPVAGIVCSFPGPQRVSCYSNSHDPDPNDLIVEYKWDMGDGSVVTSLVPSIDHTYAESSSYNISLEVKDKMGLISNVNQQITTIENQAPQANVICSPTTGTTYQCNSNAFDYDGQVVSQQWTIGGSSLEGGSIVYNFTNGGDYPVVLVATDNLGKYIKQTSVIHIDKPLADFSCTETSPFHISCHYIKSENELKTIISMRYFIDDKDVYEKESFEHDFLISGEHRVLLTSYASDGSSSIVEKIITINKRYLGPQPSFTSFAAVGLKVRFDSSDSFKQGRKVSNFKWSFGDGSEENTAEGEIDHTFQRGGVHDVTVNVVDEAGASVSITKSVYVYDAEVQDPGEINADTIEGIDSDNDGVRDDVQRWINFETKEIVEVKAVLRKLALNYQLQIVNSSDSIKINEYEGKKEKITTCLLGMTNDDELVTHYLNIFQYLYTSTELRSKAWSLIQGNLSGTSTEVAPSDQETRLLSCEGI